MVLNIKGMMTIGSEYSKLEKVNSIDNGVLFPIGREKRGKDFYSFSVLSVI